MLELLRQLRTLLGPSRSVAAIGIGILMLIGAGLEAVGIGAIMPFAAMFTDSANASGLPTWVAAALEGHTTEELLPVASAILLGVFVVKNIYLWGLYWVGYRFVYSTFSDLSLELFERYLFAPYLLHTQRNSAELLRNVTQETGRICTTILAQLFTLVLELLVVMVLATLIIVVEPLYATVIIVSVALAGATFYWLVRRKVGEYGVQRQRQSARMIQWVQQGIHGIKETKVLGVERAFGDNYSAAVSSFVDASLKYRVVNIAPRLFIETLGVAGMVAVLLLLAASGRGVAEMLPVLALFAMVAMRVMPSITRIIASLTAIRHFSPALSVVHDDLEALHEPPPIDADAVVEAGPVQTIELQDVTFRYPGADADTLAGLDLTLKRGERVGFVGASGCGKTTAIDVMLGLLDPAQGRVLIDGDDIADRGLRRSWQRKIGYIAQPTYIMDESIRTNVAFGVTSDEIDDDRVWRALRAAQLDEFVRERSDGLRTTLGEGGARLSGGQRQRIGIARALYHDPQVIILDEATSALDIETDRGVQRAIELLGRDRIVIVISHRPATIRDCDRLYFMRDGAIVDVGTFDELVERDEDFRRMLQAQRTTEG